MYYLHLRILRTDYLCKYYYPKMCFKKTFVSATIFVIPLTKHMSSIYSTFESYK